jgi:nitrogen fixation protein FixH
MSARAGRLWPAALVAVLAVTVLANVAILRLASDPGASALEPDAYAKAVAWDSTASARDRSAALGWTATARLEPAAAGARVTVSLSDRGGAPVAGARVTIEAIHNGLVRRPAATLAPADSAAAGTYVAGLPLTRPGLWEIRVRAEHGGERFVTSLRAELARVGP